ncbi:molybdate ABC transporter permease subunit [Chengkuizengella axinellae]|uniref:Molybdenum transport system permease n=1 Tax=Chengkuizengella axinellae TaxID=3064388 RepID=A0ABT9IUX9_9BACL|nr:molybdate ABC transporter permease subunit [Chengkuizengella sp. 2205SS18-9]MDP5272669.1 molybdate ABC transporter permease subunit [Chengkuizengella sp. 2205SS18-9]
MTNFELESFIAPIIISLKVALTASIVVFMFSIPLAFLMARKKFPGKSILETFFMLPMVLPPTVVGFLLLIIFGRNSWFGQTIEWLFNQPLIFTWWAAVVAAVVVSFPLVYQTLKSGFSSVEKEIENAARNSGASEWQVFRYITTPLSFKFFITAYILGFARGLGEFGATIMFAGNIPNKTQTISTAIYLAADTGNMTLVWLWVVSIILISFFMLWVVNRSNN